MKIIRMWDVMLLVEREALNQDIVCDPKIGDADYLNDLKKGQTIFGWVQCYTNSGYNR